MFLTTKNTRFKTGTLLIFFVYVTVLLKLVLFKDSFSFIAEHFSRHYNMKALHAGWTKANFLPFKSVYYYLSGQEPLQPTVENLAGNIIIFIPMGFLLPALFASISDFNKLLKAVMLVSLSFECIQLLTAYGNFDVDDILLNSLGGSMGYLIFLCRLRSVKSMDGEPAE